MAVGAPRATGLSCIGKRHAIASPSANVRVMLRYVPGRAGPASGAPLSDTEFAPVAQPGTRTINVNRAAAADASRPTVSVVVAPSLAAGGRGNVDS